MNLKTFVEELKKRNVRKTLAIYVGSALSAIGIIKLFIETYNLPTTFMPIIVIVLTCGLASAFIFAWFHGKEGVQKFKVKELLLHALVVVAAVVISFQVKHASFSPASSRVGKSVAVLPFKNLSDSKEDEYFSDGITEDILTQLSKIGDLNVLSRSSIMKYKKSRLTFREIGSELGAAAILDGTVRRDGERVRISARLVDAKTDKHIWAESYDREMKDIFAIQAEVAQNIADQLKATLSPTEKKLITKETTSNLEAYALYLRARDVYYRHSKENNELAIELFRKAIALDPNYAQAYAGLADSYVQRSQRYGMEPRWVDSSVVLCKQAMQLNPDIAEPYKSLAMAYYLKEWYRQSIELNRKALELNPNYASVYSNMGELLDWVGKPEEAVELIKKAMRLQPGRSVDEAKLGSAYISLSLDSLAMKRYEKAIELQPDLQIAKVGIAEILGRRGEATKGLAILDSALLRLPDDPSLLSGAGGVALHARKYERAEMYFRKLYDSSPDYFGTLALFGFALLKNGKTVEANKFFDQTVRDNMIAISEKSEDAFRRYDLARVYALRGDTVAALRWMREAFPSISLPYSTLYNDPLMEPLYGNNEFRSIMRSYEERIQAKRSRLLRQEELELQRD